MLLSLILILIHYSDTSSCAFDSTNGQIKCNMPNFASDIVTSLTSGWPYVSQEYISYRIEGQQPCTGSISGELERSCQNFSVMAAVGTSCTNPSESNFDSLEESSTTYCDASDNLSICSGNMVACPSRSDTSEMCCLLVKCDNIYDYCELKASVQFIIGKAIYSNSQEVPVGTSSVTVQGEGLSSDPTKNALVCYNCDKQNVPCSVSASGSKSLTIAFDPSLNYPGPLYAVLSTAQEASQGASSSYVQIAIVRKRTWRDYTEWLPYILIGVFLIFLVWCSRPSAQPKVKASPVYPAPLQAEMVYY